MKKAYFSLFIGLLIITFCNSTIIPTGDSIPTTQVIYDSYNNITSIQIDGFNYITTPIGKLLASSFCEAKCTENYPTNMNYITFYPSGELHDINTAPFMLYLSSGSFFVNRIGFYKTGSIEYIRIAYRCENIGISKYLLYNAYQINTPIGEVYTTGIIYFHPNGSIKQLTIGRYTPDIICSSDFSAGLLILTPLGRACINNISFSTNGSITGFTLHSEYYRHNNPFNFPTSLGILSLCDQIELYQDGKLKSCNFTQQASITNTGRTIYLSQYVMFSESGSVIQGQLSQPQEIQTPSGILEITGILELYENGNIKSCILNKTEEINNISFPPGVRISWNIHGRFTGIIHDISD